jgi:RNA polymerase-interacting CarD/CdnL/TRCF family regulator
MDFDDLKKSKEQLNLPKAPLKQKRPKNTEDKRIYQQTLNMLSVEIKLVNRLIKKKECSES